MFGKYFWMIFVLWGVWQAVGSLVEKAGKKQQDQRLKELTAQQQRQLGARAGRPAGAGLSGGGAAQGRTGTAGTGFADRIEGLAARRKAQLEELRRRRTAGQPSTAQAGSSPVVLRPTRAPPSTPGLGRSSLPQRGPQPVPIARSAPPARRVPRQAPVPPTTAPPPTPPVRRRAPTATEAPRVVTPEVRRPVTPQPQMDPHSVFLHTKKIVTEPVRRRRSAVYGGKPIDRALLRKMVVYREIFDPPVALRNEQVWER